MGTTVLRYIELVSYNDYTWNSKIAVVHYCTVELKIVWLKVYLINVGQITFDNELVTATSYNYSYYSYSY